MTEAAAQARREYLRQWKRANPDKVKAHQARYWERKAAEAAGQQQPAREPQQTAAE
jgi:hypothetical protein